MENYNLDELLSNLNISFIIDNTRIQLGEAVSTMLYESKSADIAIGYLFLSGFRAISGSYRHLESLRILMGHKTDRETKNFLSAAYGKPVKRSLWYRLLSLFKRWRYLGEEEARALEEEIAFILERLAIAELQALYNLIKSGKAKFRIYRRPYGYFHAKLYLFHMPFGRRKGITSSAIIGSGNFSAQGFTENTELNVYINQIDHVAKLQEWFNGRWEEAYDFNPRLIELIKDEYVRRTGKAPEIPSLWIVKFPERVVSGNEFVITVSWRNIKALKLYEIRPGEERRKVAVHDGAITNSGQWEAKVIAGEAGGVDYMCAGIISDGSEFVSNQITISIAPAEIPEEKEVPSPFDFYALSLFELFKGEIEYLRPKKTAFTYGRRDYELKKWQKDATQGLLYSLTHNQGTLLADSVGLGKTQIAVAVIRHYLESGLGGIFISCPAVLHGHWIKELGDLSDKIPPPVHQEEMGRERWQAINYKGLNLIVIDEAHGFRNPQANRYKALTDLTDLNPEAKILFVTATPINNSYRDLESLIDFFTSREELIKKEPDYEKRVAECRSDNNEERRRAYRRLREILNDYILKRTRAYIVKNFPQEATEFPQRREIELCNYQFNEDIIELLDEFEEGGKFDKLKFPQYFLKFYKKVKTAEDEQELSEVTGVSYFMRAFFLKRLESSQYAFIKSLNNHIKLLEKIEEYICRFEDEQIEEIEKWVVDINTEEELHEIFSKKITKNLIDIMKNRNDYRLEELKEAIQNDLNITRGICSRMESAHNISGDPKVKYLVDMLREDLKGEKVLIFSQYVDTVKYIYEILKPSGIFPQQEVGFMTGGIKDKEETIARFAPESNYTQDLARNKGELNLLISSDVLSEGLNLQDGRIVISYDLPWNPIKLLQREGRIDRYGSKHKSVSIYNFLPDVMLDKMINMMKKFQLKLRDIAVLGKEERIITPKEEIELAVFDLMIEKIKKRDSTVFDDLDEDAREGVIMSLRDRLRMRMKELLTQPGIEERIERIRKNIPINTAMEVSQETLDFLILVKLGEKAELKLYNHEAGSFLENEQRLLDTLDRAKIQAPKEVKRWREVRPKVEEICQDWAITRQMEEQIQSKLMVKVIRYVEGVSFGTRSKEVKEHAKRLQGLVQRKRPTEVQLKKLQRLWRETDKENIEYTFKILENFFNNLPDSKEEIVSVSSVEIIGILETQPQIG